MRAPSGTSCRRLLGAAAVAGVATALAIGPSASAHRGKPPAAQHVLLLSVDGLHEADLRLVRHPPPATPRSPRWPERGRIHPRADPRPLRLLPGDGRPGDRRQPRPPPASSTTTPTTATAAARHHECAGATPGAEVTYFEQRRQNLHSLDAGQGLAGLPGTHPGDDRQPGGRDRPGPAAGRPATCSRSTRTRYLKVNTIFEVAAEPACAPPGRTSTRPTTSCRARRARDRRPVHARRSTARRRPPARETTGPRTTR